MNKPFKSGDKVFYEYGRQSRSRRRTKTVRTDSAGTKRKPMNLLARVEELTHRVPDEEPVEVKAKVYLDELCSSCETNFGRKKIVEIGENCSKNKDSSIVIGYLVCDDCYTPDTCDCTVATMAWITPVRVDGIRSGAIDVYTDDHAHRYVPESSKETHK